MKNPKFDDLRPYYDEEIAGAMQRIAGSAYFPSLSAFVYPDRDPEAVKAQIRSYRTIDEFQLQVMKAVNEQIIARSVRRFSYDGLDRLDPRKRYLFVSNHRDIMLDSSLLQYALYRSGHRTTEITFGSNLMSSPLVVDIGKSNKMFKVVRGGNLKEFYAHSFHLSEYIRHAILEKQESIWIAQRNGRTKNGIDATDQGIIKMFYLSAACRPEQALAELNIVPVSISYQWEPCDKLKALELYRSRTEKYVKQPGEDLNSILTGIMQEKGDVHIRFGSLLSEREWSPLAGMPNNLFNKQAALLLDEQILRNYQLSCNNYIAHDLRSRSDRHANRYTQAEKEQFLRRYEDVLASEVADKAVLSDIFLGIYANPVDSQVQ
ncbi:MAG: 1-acyl-sn-glycerol-3-phosphate acyltransferase [Dysgonamonadaceae bacterium]|jgi:1-acyl-sn-glycerol-3-phosphate acyltransferase|nr:1-acyl-sn-glycerol-3-phosphate acyltransferase [Dysgonamonadaceae bacterium]